MHADIQKLVEAGKITSKTGEILSELIPGTWVLHKSWGFGQVESWNDLLGQMHIDFQTKKGHPMQFQYAAETLQIIPTGHFLIRRATERELLKSVAANEPGVLLKAMLADHDNKLTIDQIGKLMVPELMTEAEFKKWWENTKKVVKKDGIFALPAKRTDPVILRAQALSRVDELIQAFKSARQTKDQLNALDQITRSLDTFQGEIPKLQDVVSSLGSIALQNQKLQTGAALEFLIGRDDIMTAFASLQSNSGVVTIEKILRDEEGRLPEILTSIAAARVRRVLASYPVAFPERWVEKIIRLIATASTRIVGECAKLLQEKGLQTELTTALGRMIHERSLSSDGLIWFCKERDNYPDLINPGLLAAIIAAQERDQFSEKKSSRLHDLLLEDRELLPEIVADADRDAARDVMRKIMLTPVFEELNKRSLLARVIKVHPEMQAMLSGETEEKQEVLVVSWQSLEKRKNELSDLENKQIPENRKEIQIAREYGDLRENFEYKSAKDFQRVLMKRKTDLEVMLNRARGTGFEKPDLTRVSIGTVVVLTDLASGNKETYTILGAWDSEPEKGIISYLAEIGQVLLGHPIGDEVQLPTEKGVRKVRIDSIEAYTGPLAEKQ